MKEIEETIQMQKNFEGALEDGINKKTKKKNKKYKTSLLV